MNQQIAETSTDRMACLEVENEQLRTENKRLRGMLGLPPGPLPETDVEAGRLFPEDDPLPQVDARSPAQEKIALFRALFRGREDVYARYWCDERSGKKGYSPAARSRSGRGGKDYLPLTDEVFYRHLAGEEIVGLYPLLPDDTCRVLACDFDGPTWTPDALGFLEAADRWRVPAYLERSRSGQGGTSGSSSRARCRRSRPGDWVPGSCARPWSPGARWSSRATTACSRTRTSCPRAASAI